MRRVEHAIGPGLPRRDALRIRGGPECQERRHRDQPHHHHGKPLKIMIMSSCCMFSRSVGARWMDGGRGFHSAPRHPGTRILKLCTRTPGEFGAFWCALVAPGRDHIMRGELIKVLPYALLTADSHPSTIPADHCCAPAGITIMSRILQLVALVQLALLARLALGANFTQFYLVRCGPAAGPRPAPPLDRAALDSQSPNPQAVGAVLLRRARLRAPAAQQVWAGRWAVGAARHAPDRARGAPCRQAFSIHGLWPDYGNGSWPEFCQKDAHVNVTDLADLVPEMERKWPSLTGVCVWGGGPATRRLPGRPHWLLGRRLVWRVLVPAQPRRPLPQAPTRSSGTTSGRGTARAPAPSWPRSTSSSARCSTCTTT
jgi:hypothetical protein